MSSWDRTSGEVVIEVELSAIGTFSGLSISGESPPLMPLACGGGGIVWTEIGIGGGRTKIVVASAM